MSKDNIRHAFLLLNKIKYFIAPSLNEMHKMSNYTEFDPSPYSHMRFSLENIYWICTTLCFWRFALDVASTMNCPLTRRKSLLGIGYTGMRKISRWVTRPVSICSTTSEKTTDNRLWLSCIYVHSASLNHILFNLSAWCFQFLCSSVTLRRHTSHK